MLCLAIDSRAKKATERDDQISPVTRVEKVNDLRDIVLYRVSRDTEFASDFVVSPTCSDQHQHLALTWREGFHSTTEFVPLRWHRWNDTNVGRRAATLLHSPACCLAARDGGDDADFVAVL